MSATSRPQRVHGLAGVVPAAGGKTRAVCFCGHQTTPRATRARALEALESEHGSTRPMCAVCGRNRECWAHPDGCWDPHCCAGAPIQERYRDVRVVADGAGTIFVCADDERACLDAAARRQVELDRAALGDAVPAPRLRLIAGGAR